jgi:hypothetical protein
MGSSICRQRPPHVFLVLEVTFVVATDIPLATDAGSINSRFDAMMALLETDHANAQNSLDEGRSFSKMMRQTLAARASGDEDSESAQAGPRSTRAWSCTECGRAWLGRLALRGWTEFELRAANPAY